MNTDLVRSAILFPLKNLSAHHDVFYFFIYPIVKHNDFAVLALGREKEGGEKKKKHNREHLSFQSHTKFSIMKIVTNAFVITSIRL